MDRKTIGVGENVRKMLDGFGREHAYASDLFGHMGWKDIFTTTLKESSEITKELFSKPSSLKNMSHCLFLSSIVQIIGGLLGLCGLSAIGAPLRNVSGMGVDFSLAMDKKTDKPIDKITPEDIAKFKERKKNPPKEPMFNFDSLFVWASFTWITAAVVDQLKRIPFIGEGLSNPTNLSLASDRGASLLYTLENLKIPGSKTISVDNREITPEQLLAELAFGYTKLAKGEEANKEQQKREKSLQGHENKTGA
jgi:hypothetical protein